MDTETISSLIARMRALEADHTPNGYPAVIMKDITALCDEIERLQGRVDFVTKMAGETCQQKVIQDILDALTQKDHPLTSPGMTFLGKD